MYRYRERIDLLVLTRERKEEEGGDRKRSNQGRRRRIKEVHIV